MLLRSCLVLLALTADASAYKVFQARIPNGGNVPGVEAVGHERPNVGGPNNDFGLDFIGAMFQWNKAFCMKDSDGDGQTNGQELGDPCCEFEFRKNDKVRWTEGVSHPGDKESTADPKLWEGIVCGGETREKEADEITEKETEQEVEQQTEKEVEVAVQGQNDEVEAAGTPALFSSMVLSVAALSVVLVYFAVVRLGRRSTRLPIFRQQRRGPM